MTRVVPAHGSYEYEWWKRGAEAEHEAIRDGINEECWGVIQCAIAVGQYRSSLASIELVSALARIYITGKLKRRHRK